MNEAEKKTVWRPADVIRREEEVIPRQGTAPTTKKPP